MIAEIISDSTGVSFDRNLINKKLYQSNYPRITSPNYPLSRILQHFFFQEDCFLATSIIINPQKDLIQLSTNDLVVNNVDYSGELSTYEEMTLVHKKTHFQLKDSFIVKGKVKFIGKIRYLSDPRIIEINS